MKGSRSMTAAKVAVGSTPTWRTTREVYSEMVRVPSARRSPARASASPRGDSAFRIGEAYRQERVERRAVEGARPHTRHEVKPWIRPGTAARAPEHSHVELVLERVELLRKRGRERKRIPRPPNHEQLPPHRRLATRSSSSAIRPNTAFSVYPDTE